MRVSRIYFDPENPVLFWIRLPEECGTHAVPFAPGKQAFLPGGLKPRGCPLGEINETWGWMPY